MYFACSRIYHNSLLSTFQSALLVLDYYVLLNLLVTFVIVFNLYDNCTYLLAYNAVI